VRHKVDRRVLASSIDLDIEFHAIALVQAGKPRTLDRADMHEGIGLAIIARDKAETLHRVEELDRAGRLLTSQLTLRRRLTLGNRDHVANDLQVTGGNLASAVDELKFELLPFGKTFESGTLDRADVDEHVIAAFIALDEAETLRCIEELDRSLALADDLGRHAATGSATAAAARAAAEAATRARSAAETTAAIVTAGEAVATAAKAVSAAAKAILPATSEEGIELVLSEPIPLVTSPTATTSVKTHF